MSRVLVIGNKNYSSWSLRPWLALTEAGIAFEERRIVLDQPQTKVEILRHSPSGKVPCLIDGELVVWDSLAICETANERYAGHSAQQRTDVATDIARIQAIWSDCLERRGGPLLFGAFSIADASFAPVVTRFRTYGVELPAPLARYAETVLGLKAMQRWVEAAAAETEVITY